MTINFQIASDLHIEYKSDKTPDMNDYIIPKAKYIILAGDIGSLYKYNQLKEFLTQICNNFEKVIYVLGNHEFYTQNGYDKLHIKQLYMRIQNLEESIDNLYILNRKFIIIDNVCIAGCTLWSKPEVKIPRYIVRINNITNRSFYNNHMEDLKFLKHITNVCKQNNYKLLVVTHYIPSYSLMPDNRKNDKLASLYANNLDELCQTPIVSWVCGHIHHNFDMKIGSVRVVSNQKGKIKDGIIDYKKDYILTV